jgi:hypothetical protein
VVGDFPARLSFLAFCTVRRSGMIILHGSRHVPVNAEIGNAEIGKMVPQCCLIEHMGRKVPGSERLDKNI